MSTNKKQIKKELRKVSKLVSKLSKKRFKRNLDNMTILHLGVSDMKVIVKYVLKENYSKTNNVSKDGSDVLVSDTSTKNVESVPRQKRSSSNP